MGIWRTFCYYLIIPGNSLVASYYWHQACCAWKLLESEHKLGTAALKSMSGSTSGSRAPGLSKERCACLAQEAGPLPSFV
ncbi:hypothetical protein QQP08_008387 [Theobroma cacao]|nr:hypothetical protein QQP08_008248 [Theobroma cacao]WRX15900.1 hypothetical protein QQP08_008387 [Theobroma cacao]